MFDGARLIEHDTHEARVVLLLLAPSEALEDHVGQRAIHVVATESAVAAGRFDLEDAVVEQQDRDVERAAAEIVDRERPVLLLVEPVGECCSRRLVQKTQHFEPCQPSRVLGGLALRVVEVGRHRDDSTADGTKLVFREPLQRPENVRAHLDRSDDAVPHVEAHDVRLPLLRREELVRPEPQRLRVIGAAPHEALHADDRLARVIRRARLGELADLDGPFGPVRDDAGQQHLEVAVGDGVGAFVLHARDKRVGGTEIDADGLRCGFRVEDLEERHDGAPRSSTIADASSRKRR